MRKLDDDLIEFCEEIKEEYKILNSEEEEFIKKIIKNKCMYITHL